MRKILHLRTVVGSGGGPEKTILNTPGFLPDAKVQIAYIRPRDDPDYDLVERANEVDVDFIDVPESSGFDLRTVYKLRKIIRKFNPDIIHPHDYKTNFLTLLCKQRKTVCISTCHGYVSHDSRLNLYYKVDQYSLKRMNHVITVSNDIHSQVVKMGVEPSRITTIFNGIDCHAYRRTQSSRTAKNLLEISHNRTLIGAVGRLSEEKGFHLLIAACERLIKNGHDIDLAIIGEGQQREQLEKQIADSEFADHFHLLGYQAETIPYYEAMDLFVLSSLREGLPNVLLEAMAMEVPVVSTNIAGVSNLIDDSVHGILIEAESIDALVAGVEKALNNEDLRAAMVKKARTRIEDEFSFENRMSKVSQIYDQLLGE